MGIDYQVRTYSLADMPEVMAIQERHAATYPGAAVVPGEVYAGPGFQGGQNVFCAVLPDGRLAGYAPLYPVPVTGADPDAPHVMWAEVKVEPDLADRDEVREQLMARVLERARALAGATPGHPCRLTFQYLPNETEPIGFLLRKGGAYSESVFRMWRDLAQPLPDAPAPPGIEVRLWRMPSPAEQRVYIEAYNEAFPEAPMALADWQYFLGSPHYAAGGSIAAFAGDDLAGCVTVYWDEEANRRMEEQAGYTEYIFTRPAWRGRGIARCLVRTALAFLRDHGLAEARLEVRARNEAALELYRSLGYAVGQETRLYVLEV